MTQEEKAKAYDEALEQAKFYHENCPSEPERKKLEKMFPELRESEDERIRKAIRLILIATEDEQKDFYSTHGLTRKDCTDWLEKQKERMAPVYDNQDSFESALEKAWNNYHNGYENVDKLEDDYVECAHAKGFREGYLFGIEKQKEKKQTDLPAGFYVTLPDGKKYYTKEMRCNGMNVKVVEPKPAEWSEEDEKMRNLAIEWAETMSGQFSFVDMDSTDFCKIINWLKSIRPPFKPSEEQLNALNFAITYFMHETNYNNPTELRDLYDDLLKLK